MNSSASSVMNLGLIVVTIILPTKGGTAVDQADELGVGYRDTMGITTEISQDLLGSAEGRLGVDHPTLCGAYIASLSFSAKTVGCASWARLPKKPKPPRVKCSLQALKEQAAEEPGKHAHRQEEAWSTAHPSACHRGMDRRQARRNARADDGGLPRSPMYEARPLTPISAP